MSFPSNKGNEDQSHSESSDLLCAGRISDTVVVDNAQFFESRDNMAKPDEKLLNPLRCILNEEDTSGFAIKPHFTDVNINPNVQSLPMNYLCNATNELLGDDIVLINIPYDDNARHINETPNTAFMENTVYQNNIKAESDIFEYNQKSNYKEIDHDTCNSPSKILTVLTPSNTSNSHQEKTLESHTMDNSGINLSANEKNMKTLTVLDSLEMNAIDNFRELYRPNVTNGSNEYSEDFIISEDFRSGENFKGAEPYEKPKETIVQAVKAHQLETMSFNSNKKPNCTKLHRNSKTAVKNRSKKAKTATKSIIDLETVTTQEKGIKQDPVVQKTYSHKKKANKNINENAEQSLYQKILPSKEEITEKVPDKFAVFDFYDEEAESRELAEKEKQEALEILKERTCIHCKEIFKDPIDVLRHKREAHKHRKIELTIEEIEPYLHLENRIHCPLCYKLIHACGYKSWYVKHLMTHCKNSYVTCRVCDAKFKRRDHMLTHEKRHMTSREDN